MAFRVLMMMMMILSTSILSVGCGKSATTQQTQAVGKSIFAAYGGMSSAISSGMGGSSGLRVGDVLSRSPELQRDLKLVENLAAVMIRSDSSSRACSYTTTIPVTLDALSCTIGCADTNTTRISCTLTRDFSASCGGETSTISSGTTITSDLDMSALTVSGSSYSGTFRIKYSIAGNVTSGTVLSGTAVNCNFNLSLTYPLATESARPTVDCASAYSCTVSGATVSCTDLQTSFATAPACSVEL